MFKVKDITYDLRDSNQIFYVNQNLIRKLSYYGKHIWNSLPKNIKQCTSLDNFKTMTKAWEGPKSQCSICNASNEFLV